MLGADHTFLQQPYELRIISDGHRSKQGLKRVVKARTRNTYSSQMTYFRQYGMIAAAPLLASGY
jgi:hypothetical protein